jgi:arylsulfatase A
LLSRRSLLKAAASLPLLSLPQARADIRPPNIIVILTDDLGFGDVGFNGSKIVTTNLNSLASKGVTLQQFYSANPVCSPSRASLLTGRYPTRVGVPDIIFPTDNYGLHDDETTVAQMLSSAGYATICIGKWHLGSMVQFMPTNRGFGEFYGVPYSNDMSPLPLIHNLDVVEANTDNDWLTQKYTTAAVNFIAANKQRPFFMYLAHNVPHIPFGASPAFKGKSPLGPYADAVEELDWSVGQVIQALSDNGIERNTLAIFTSDNGPWFQGSPGRLRGRKGETYEGGMREPFIAYMPGTIPAGLQCSGVGSMLDLLPTFAAISGATLPGQPLDGINIWPLFTGDQTSIARDVLLYFDSWNIQCARLGPWKLHMARYNAFPWVEEPPEGRINLPLHRPELYNVELDPEEAYECGTAHLDIVDDIQNRVIAMLPSFPSRVQAAWADTQSLNSQYRPAGSLPVPAPQSAPSAVTLHRHIAQ